MDGSSLERNLRKLQARMVEAYESAGRTDADVRLIAVSKTKPIAQIREVYSLGQMEFAENYAQELEEKAEQLSSTKICWHFIGPLQTNKVKKVVGVASLIHSVDRLNLAKEIAKVAEQKKIVQDILVQVNVANEPSKGGVSLEDLPDLMKQILSFSALRPVGLMTMPPMASDATRSKKYFVQLREALQDLKSKFPQELGSNFKHLSMGTSQDFVVAIGEGATYIRVGTEIFGHRTSGTRSG